MYVCKPTILSIFCDTAPTELTNCLNWRTEDGWATWILMDASLGWNQVKFTFSKLNNNVILSTLSLTNTIWFLEDVICYNENKTGNTLKLYYCLLICIVIVYLYIIRYQRVSVPYFPPSHYCCKLEINSESWPSSLK